MKHFLRLIVESYRSKVELRGIREELTRHMESVDGVLKWMEMCERGRKAWDNEKKALTTQVEHLNKVNKERVKEIENLKRENKELRRN